MESRFRKIIVFTAASAFVSANLVSLPAARADDPPAVSADTTIGPSSGSLVIVGGGLVGPEIWQRFIELAGGKDAKIVVIPTAGEAASADGVPRTGTPDASTLR